MRNDIIRNNGEIDRAHNLINAVVNYAQCVQTRNRLAAVVSRIREESSYKSAQNKMLAEAQEQVEQSKAAVKKVYAIWHGVEEVK